MDQNKIPHLSVVLSRWFDKFNTLSRTTQGMLLLGLLAGVIILLGALSQGTPVDIDESLPSLIFNVGLKLVIVLLLIYISAIILKKFGIASFQKTSRSMEIVETLSLSPRRSLYIVKVGNRQMLIGATDQSINLIQEIEKPSSENNENPGQLAEF